MKIVLTLVLLDHKLSYLHVLQCSHHSSSFFTIVFISFSPGDPLALGPLPLGYPNGKYNNNNNNGSRRPVCYVSRSLAKIVSHYSQIEREDLAIVFALKHLHSYLYGRVFKLCTDHKLLMSLFGENCGLPATAVSRLQGRAVIPSGYDYVIEHLPCHENCVADCMSRIHLKLSAEREITVIYAVEDNIRDPVEDVPVSAADVAMVSMQDPDVSRVIDYIAHGWPSLFDESLKSYYNCRNELTIDANCLVRGHRTIIPNVLRRSLLKELQSLHIDLSRMKSAARTFF